MAALIGYRTFGHSFVTKNALLTVITIRHDLVRHKQNRSIPKATAITAKWEWDEKSIASKGFLRSHKPYTPPQDVSQRFDAVCQSEGILNQDNNVIQDLQERFKLFSACTKEFNHSIPNSTLHEIETIGDLREFYKTPVNTTIPLDVDRKYDLPKNLHILYEYNRFHPDTDTMFGGKTAFPKSSTIVTGLKYKKKYPGFIDKNPFV